MGKISLKTKFGISASVGFLAGALFVAQANAQTNIGFYNSSALPANGLQSGGDQFGNPFTLGLSFTVNTPIKITALGAYDYTIGGTGTGFATTINVGIYNTATSAFVGPSVSFLGNSGATGGVVDSFQFQTINAFTLNVGTYIIVGAGYGGVTSAPYTPDWNAAVAGVSPSPIVLNDGAGTLTIGSTFYADDPNGVLLPPTINGGAGALVAAGTFKYTVPEPSAAELALVGAALLGAVRFGRRFLAVR